MFLGFSMIVRRLRQNLPALEGCRAARFPAEGITALIHRHVLHQKSQIIVWTERGDHLEKQLTRKTDAGAPWVAATRKVRRFVV